MEDFKKIYGRSIRRYLEEFKKIYWRSIRRYNGGEDKKIRRYIGGENKKIYWGRIKGNFRGVKKDILEEKIRYV